MNQFLQAISPQASKNPNGKQQKHAKQMTTIDKANKSMDIRDQHHTLTNSASIVNYMHDKKFDHNKFIIVK